MRWRADEMRSSGRVARDEVAATQHGCLEMELLSHLDMATPIKSKTPATTLYKYM
jgi:hypothetical protein